MIRALPYAILATGALTMGALVVNNATAQTPADEPSVITVDPPIAPPTLPTGDLHCVDKGVNAGRGPTAEGNQTGDWEQDLDLDCGDFNITVTISASSTRQLVINMDPEGVLEGRWP